MSGSADAALDVSHVRVFQSWGQRASRQSLSENSNLGLKTYPGAPVRFFGRKMTVRSRSKSTSVHSRPPTGSRYHLKRFNFVLSGQLSRRRWSQYILFSSSSQNKKSYVDFGPIPKNPYFFPNSANEPVTEISALQIPTQGIRETTETNSSLSL